MGEPAETGHYVEQHTDQFAPPQEQEGEIAIPVDSIRQALTSLELPLGWTTCAPKTSAMISAAREAGHNVVLAVISGWLLKGVGWLATGLATS